MIKVDDIEKNLYHLLFCFLKYHLGQNFVTINIVDFYHTTCTYVAWYRYK